MQLRVEHRGTARWRGQVKGRGSGHRLETRGRLEAWPQRVELRRTCRWTTVRAGQAAEIGGAERLGGARGWTRSQLQRDSPRRAG